MKGKSIFWGFLFLCAAGVIVANQLGLFAQVGLVSLLLTLALAFIIIKGIIDINFFEILIPAAVILIIYADPLGIAYLTPWPILIVALLTSIGLSLIFRKHAYRGFKKYKKGHGDHMETTENLDDDVIISKTSFSGGTKYLYSKNLKRADFSVSFGGLKVFFDQVTLSPEGADINIDASFSGVELYIPRNWNVKNNMSASIGGVDMKGVRCESTGPTLRLNGNVTLGGVEVHYI